MKVWLETFTAVTMGLLAVWQWRQLYRHPTDRVLRPLTFGVTAVAIVLLGGIDAPPFTWVHPYTNKVADAALAFLFFCYSVFFLLARMSDPERNAAPAVWRVRIEFAIGAVFIAASYIVRFVGVDEQWWTSRSIERYASVRNWTYYLTGSGYTLAIWVVGTIRAIKYLKTVTHRWARVSIIGVIVATGLITFGVDVIPLVRQVWYLFNAGDRWPFFTHLYNFGRLTGQCLLAVALCAAPLAALVSTLKGRRDRRFEIRLVRRLSPLWQVLSAEFPHIALPTSTPPTARPPRLDRMVIEVSDGLAYLAPWAPPRAEAPSTVVDDVAMALSNKRAFGVARWTGQQRHVADDQLPQWEPDVSSWRERALWMAKLSDVLQQRDVLPMDLAERS
ncbi:DUF6545 domain-containing protein [Pseudonocardia alni]|uniref:DUF6545 domain-containing protein n=1 Tax=Pseudonocardia alni TaxID=33907 RepID=UPI00280C340C|nr:DUF6545 domain-containing protein [Pseudonocardia alni]